MPAAPRRAMFHPDVMGVYHCWNRGARGIHFCGVDEATGIDYEYRRQWVIERQELLAGWFGIDVCWQSVLSNHIHLILRNRPDVVSSWSDKKVVRHMLSINRLTKSNDGRIRQPTSQEIKAIAKDARRVAVYRRRLSDISCFMGSLCEHLTRRINAEEGRTGTLWEGRFKSRALEDETATGVCGIYVDLNQIRCGEARTPETSKYTSAYLRIQRYQLEQSGRLDRSATTRLPDAWLAELALDQRTDVDLSKVSPPRTDSRCSDKGLLPMTAAEYFELLDWSGRQIAEGKRGAIPDHLAPILERLHIKPDRWLDAVSNFEQLFGRSVGRPETVAARAAEKGDRWVGGIRNCRAVFD